MFCYAKHAIVHAGHATPTRRLIQDCFVTSTERPANKMCVKFSSVTFTLSFDGHTCAGATIARC